MKRDRYFYTGVGAVFLVLIVLGFRHYIFGGRLDDGEPILPGMLTAIVVHSTAIFAWFLLYFVQAVLIPTGKRKLHMKLGWAGVAIAVAIVLTGPYVALCETRLEPNPVFDWPDLSFLLVMLTEIALFAVFVTIGVLNRKRPRIHRPMMLLASLSLISGATARIPLTHAIFGEHQWMGLFAAVAVLGLILLLVRWALTRSLERPFAVGYAALVVVTLAASQLALTKAWVNVAAMIARL
ncbi:MAG TPA: hypothetical protein VMV57_11465 [Terracidiphilus sp.]|nr:hypothetical protein [Terracidiphilus sp.]